MKSLTSSAVAKSVGSVSAVSLPNSRLRAARALLVDGADDLRQGVQLLVGLALGDPLGAEGEEEVHADPQVGVPLDPLADELGRARTDRAAQAEQLVARAGGG